MNFRLTIQYDGTDFHGWQIQDNQRTVQGELTRVLSLIEGRNITVHGAGRTDAGVHAVAQVASVDLESGFSCEKWRAAINGNLERDVRVISVEEASPDFHARYSARGKTYQYRIFNAHFMSPFWFRYALHESRALDLARMRESAELFIGQHEWTAFSSTQSDVTSRVRAVTSLSVEERWSNRSLGNLITIEISADGFLRYMVRSIVGTFLAVGRGEINDDTILRAISTGDRSLAAATAPAHGLTLTRVHYD